LGNSVDILANGPSLKSYTFNKDRVTIGMNIAYRYWETIDYLPTFYICLDTVVVEDHSIYISKLIDSKRIKAFFLSDEFFKIYPKYKTYDNVYSLSQCKEISKIVSSSPHITTGSFSIRIAMAMGFKNLYLYGFDCNYVNFIPESKVIGDNNGVKILQISKNPVKNPNYFFDSYQRVGDKYHVPNHSKVYKCPCPYHKGNTAFGGKLHKESFDILRFDMKRLNLKNTIRSFCYVSFNIN